MSSLTDFGGIYVAARFAYGSPGGPPPLSMLNGNEATGAQTVSLVYGYAITQDGTQFFPLTDNTPVAVGYPGGTETVTPTTISGDGGQYGGQTMLATFAAAHGNGTPLISATYGLQEALNFAALQGGGTVIVDAEWVAQGGTSGMISGATVPSGVTIQDNRTGGGIGAVDSVFGRTGAVVAVANDYDYTEVENAVGNAAVSVASEIALFDGTTGNLLKSATGTGFVKVVDGVYQVPAAAIPLSVIAGAGAGVPASAAAAGVAGQVAYESGFLYICVATNTWERVAIAAW